MRATPAPADWRGLQTAPAGRARAAALDLPGLRARDEVHFAAHLGCCPAIASAGARARGRVGALGGRGPSLPIAAVVLGDARGAGLGRRRARQQRLGGRAVGDSRAGERAQATARARATRRSPSAVPSPRRCHSSSSRELPGALGLLCQVASADAADRAGLVIATTRRCCSDRLGETRRSSRALSFGSSRGSGGRGLSLRREKNAARPGWRPARSGGWGTAADLSRLPYAQRVAPGVREPAPQHA